MKHLANTVVHGVHLLRQLKEGHLSKKDFLPANFHTTAARTAYVRALGAVHRRLMAKGAAGSNGDESWESSAFFLDEEPAGDGFFSSLTSGFGANDAEMEVLMESVVKCGIDVEDMASKAMGAIFSSGIDLSDPASSGSDGLEEYLPILLALKDDDEEECTDSDTTELLLASINFYQCAGVSQFIDVDSIANGGYQDDLEVVADSCGEFYHLIQSEDLQSSVGGEDFFPNETTEAGKSGQRCLEGGLGDNPLGNYFRYLYNNYDQVLKCAGIFGEELPRCVVTIPESDEVPAVSFPLSLEKKLLCVVDSMSDLVIESICTSAFGSLDSCLPEVDHAFDSEAVANTCADDGFVFVGKQELFWGMDASVVTGNKLPGFCASVFEEYKMNIADLQRRFDYYNEHREYGWTIESAKPSDVQRVSDTTPQDAVHAVEEPEDEEEYESNPEDITVDEPVDWDNGEAIDDSNSSKARPLPIFVFGVVGVAALVFGMVHFGGMINRMKSSPNVARKNYSQVMPVQNSIV